MRTHAVRTGAALVLTAGLVAGCESSPRRTPYADNPLVQARLPMLPPQAVAILGAVGIPGAADRVVDSAAAALCYTIRCCSGRTS